MKKMNSFRVGTLVEVLSTYSVDRVRRGIIVARLPQDKVRVKMLDSEVTNDYKIEQVRISYDRS